MAATLNHSRLGDVAAKRWFGITACVAFVGTWIIARAVLEMQGLATPVRIGAALVPVLPFVFLLGAMAAGVRRMDELQRRIQLEALAFAFPLTLVLLMTLGLMELAIPLDPDDWSYRHVWAMLPTLYFVGLFLALRRYQ